MVHQSKEFSKKPLIAAMLLALALAPVVADDVVTLRLPRQRARTRLVMMDRVSDPQLSPDGRYAAFGVRSTDYAANKGVNAIYVLALGKDGKPVKVLDKGSAARWSVAWRQRSVRD